jgi:putative PIN family toxin of toxin-antitoxin system
MVRVVADTNVLVSALVGHGKPKRLVLQLLEGHVVVSSSQMLAELADVLSREKFREVRSSQVDRYLSNLVRKCRLVKSRSRFRVVAEDPDDDLVLNTAYDGKADYIVTGDKHLLALQEFKVIKIVTVNEMLQVLVEQDRK